MKSKGYQLGFKEGQNLKENFEQEVVDYFKGKDLGKADRLLMETAQNNFKVGIKKGEAEQKQSEINWLRDYITKLKVSLTCKGLTQDNVQMINANIEVHEERIKELEK